MSNTAEAEATVQVSEMEKRIRDKAHRDLKDELDKKFEPIHRAFQIGFSLAIPEGEITHNTRAHDMVQILKKVLLAHLTIDRQRNAVRDFIKRIDGLEVEVGNLRQEVSHRSGE